MANEQNLKMIQNENQAREMGKKGGKRSGEVRRTKKTMREVLDYLLEKTIKAKNGVEMTTREAILVAAVAKAGKGNVKALEFIRDTIGEKPVDKVIADMNLTQALVVFDEVEEAKEENATGDGEDSGEIPSITN